MRCPTSIPDHNISNTTYLFAALAGFFGSCTAIHTPMRARTHLQVQAQQRCMTNHRARMAWQSLPCFASKKANSSGERSGRTPLSSATAGHPLTGSSTLCSPLPAHACTHACPPPSPYPILPYTNLRLAMGLSVQSCSGPSPKSPRPSQWTPPLQLKIR